MKPNETQKPRIEAEFLGRIEQEGKAWKVYAPGGKFIALVWSRKDARDVLAKHQEH